MAGRPPTDVVETIRPRNCEPMIDSWIIASPTAIWPRACRTAIRAHVPVPVGLRSDRPGATMQVLRVTLPTPSNGRLSWTMETPRIPGFSGWTTSSCSRAASRICSPATASSRASEGSTRNPSFVASTIA